MRFNVLLLVLNVLRLRVGNLWSLVFVGERMHTWDHTVHVIINVFHLTF